MARREPHLVPGVDPELCQGRSDHPCSDDADAHVVLRRSCRSNLCDQPSDGEEGVGAGSAAKPPFFSSRPINAIIATTARPSTAQNTICGIRPAAAAPPADSPPGATSTAAAPTSSGASSAMSYVGAPSPGRP